MAEGIINLRVFETTEEKGLPCNLFSEESYSPILDESPSFPHHKRFRLSSFEKMIELNMFVGNQVDARSAEHIKMWCSRVFRR